MPDDWRTVTELPPIHADRSFETRVAVVEGKAGLAVRITKRRRDPRTGELTEGGRSVVVFSDRIAALVLSLEQAAETITTLRRAGRRVA